ncbi:MAG: lasso peptide biosynthesis B2 protein [Gemmatimonadetes bacterium]|nr:lasso peptide biosynthesis B2 protein [Gemmatimonadota bacterium]
MKRLERLARLPPRDWLLLIEATLVLGIASAAVRLLTFPRVARRLGEFRKESPEGEARAAVTAARRIRWAVFAASRRLPWKPLCLPQAIAAKIMLRRRGIASTLYLGVDRKDGFEAHAWVRVGRTIVTGGASHASYVVVSSFA